MRMWGTTTQQLPLLLIVGFTPVLFTSKFGFMPAYFVKNTAKGIVVSNKPLGSKEVTLKNGQKRTMSMQVSDLKFGFFACENPQEIGYVSGEKIPVSLTGTKVAEDIECYWCNPD